MKRFGIFLSALSRSDPRTLWRRYACALSIIMALVICGHYASLSASKLAGKDAETIALASNQATLSQSILYHSLRLAAESETPQARATLRTLIEEFESAHQDLLSGINASALRPINSERLHPIFFDGIGDLPPLNEQVKSFAQQAWLIYFGTLDASETIFNNIVDLNAQDLLTSLNMAADAFAEDSRDRGSSLRNVQQWTFFAALAILLLEALVIFWPAHLAATTAMKRLEEERKAAQNANLNLSVALCAADQARRAAEVSDRSKSMFFANMSHELRTPLNAILGFSAMINQQMLGPVGNDQYVEYAGDIEGAGTHLLTLIGDLMDLSHIELGKADVDFKEISVEKLLTRMQPLIEGSANIDGRDIHFDLETAPEKVVVDVRRITQIILNLLSNAVKFTSNDDRIRLAISDDGAGGMALVVEDTGPGFDLSRIEGLTQPFERGENAFVREQDGVGLGLSLVKGFTELHGGSVTFENIEPSGARVCVTIPAIQMYQDDHGMAA